MKQFEMFVLNYVLPIGRIGRGGYMFISVIALIVLAVNGYFGYEMHRNISGLVSDSAPVTTAAAPADSTNDFGDAVTPDNRPAPEPGNSAEVQRLRDGLQTYALFGYSMFSAVAIAAVWFFCMANINRFRDIGLSPGTFSMVVIPLLAMGGFFFLYFKLRQDPHALHVATGALFTIFYTLLVAGFTSFLVLWVILACTPERRPAA